MKLGPMFGGWITPVEYTPEEGRLSVDEFCQCLEQLVKGIHPRLTYRRIGGAGDGVTWIKIIDPQIEPGEVAPPEVRPMRHWFEKPSLQEPPQ